MSCPFPIGTYYWANGKRYEGNFVRGKRTGFGVMYTGDGDRYEGEWKDGKPAGKGTMFQEGGLEIKVEWRADGKAYPQEPMRNSKAQPVDFGKLLEKH